jgi:hypothetical protein
VEIDEFVKTQTEALLASFPPDPRPWSFEVRDGGRTLVAKRPSVLKYYRRQMPKVAPRARWRRR